jgi:hypothetical protein
MLSRRSRQFRNPRFAPDGLERRLNPSALGVNMPPFQLAMTGGVNNDGNGGAPTLPADPDPIPGTGVPPLLPANPPTGPVGPA